MAQLGENLTSENRMGVLETEKRAMTDGLYRSVLSWKRNKNMAF